MLNLYITSPTKGDGKSFLTAGLAATMQSLGYSTSVYKPIQTDGIEINGFTQSRDLTFIKTIDPYISTNFSYLYTSGSEPLISSEIENEPIDINLIKTEFVRNSVSDCTIVDGECGILSPIAPKLQNADIVQLLNIPVLIVATPTENNIEQILSNIFVVRNKNLNLRGVILNNIEEECSKQILTYTPRIIEEYSGTKILGIVPKIKQPITPNELIGAIINGIDVESVFNVKIEKLDLGE